MSRNQVKLHRTKSFDICFCVILERWYQNFLLEGDWVLGSASSHFWVFSHNFRILSVQSFRNSYTMLLFVLVFLYHFTCGKSNHTKILKCFIISCSRSKEVLNLKWNGRHLNSYLATQINQLQNWWFLLKVVFLCDTRYLEVEDCLSKENLFG